MLFESSRPVTGTFFFDRERELEWLLESVRALEQGSTRYLALIGPRKTGKTSLLRQLMQELNAGDVLCFEMDCWEKKLTPRLFFLDYLVQVIEAFLRHSYPDRIRLSIRASLADEANLLSALADIRALGIESLARATQTLLQLRANQLSDTLFAAVIDLPEQIAQEAGVYFVAMLDEFQELADLNRFKDIRQNIGDVYALLRSRWQRHHRVNYIVAGSKLSMMRELLTREQAPFFQHFRIVEIGEFPDEEAKRMLRVLSEGTGNPLPEEIIERLLELVGTNPFYLQILGEELCRGPVDADRLKLTLQEVLFNPMGRLSLYFQDLFGRAVGRSASLERTLVTLAHHPGTLTSLAQRMGVGTGTLKSWIDRVSDFVQNDSGTYQIADRCFRLWLQGRSELRAILPPLVLGDEAEKRVARQMAKAGFELVYQSRASRGAFDLLAILQTTEVGVQVKRATLPYYLRAEELRLMQYWAKRLDWKPLLAIVTGEQVTFYDVRDWQTQGASFRVDEATLRVENLLSLTADDVAYSRPEP